jgi:hypothetical protein
MRNDQQAVLEDGTLATPVCPHSPSDYLLFITSSYRDDPLRRSLKYFQTAIVVPELHLDDSSAFAENGTPPGALR